MIRFELVRSATIVQDVLTEILGYQGIVISGLSALILVILLLAIFRTEHRTVRKFVIPLAVIYLGVVTDRFVTGGALLSSATELDLSSPQKLLSALARLLMIVGLVGFAYGAYTAYRDRESHSGEP